MNNYDVETDEYLKHGLTVFQCRLFGDSEQAHIKNYCAWFKPTGVVVDMGAGVGAMGMGIQRLCPDVSLIVNVTNSPVQAEYIEKAGGYAVLRDYHDVPEVLDACADFVMFNETLGYGNLQKLMQESSRMLCLGGRLVIKDFSPVKPADFTDLTGWGYKVPPVHEVVGAAAAAGLRCTVFAIPAVSGSLWEEFMQESKMAEWHGTVSYPLDSSVYVFERVES